MKISFHGAAQTVTGSKHLLSLNSGKNILLDCGMFQGLGSETFMRNTDFGFDISQLDAIILSHAHIDHSGLIPLIVKKGFRGKIYATQATFDLCKIMLPDSGFIQEADARFVNKRKRKQGKEDIVPLYTKEDAEYALNFFFPLAYNTPHALDKHSHFIFTNNGHILGSAAVTITEKAGGVQTVFTYTSDIGRYNTTLMKNPESFPQSDFIVCESTYGNRLHDTQVHAEQKLLDVVLQTCVEKKGKLIIPSFSLGRTQEIVFTLNKLQLHGLLPRVPIYVDSPLSTDATEVMRKYIHLLNDTVQEFTQSRSDPFGFNCLRYITDKKESQALNTSSQPCIIISASGMAEAGRAKHHIMHAISHPQHTILLVGYAEPNSLAGRLRNGADEVSIFGESFKVKCAVKVLDAFSAHADYKEIERYLKCQQADKVRMLFLVHGNKDAQEHMKEYLKRKGFSTIVIPSLHATHVLA